jgi:protein gp37
MGKETGISWTSHSFNPWWGCTKVSPGCDHCYAETLDARWGDPHWGKGVPRRVFGDKHWAEPLLWNIEASKAGVREMVFCASMADVMDDEAPEGQFERLLKLIDQTPNLIWQLLTKRPQRYERRIPLLDSRDNIWLGTSAENQENYDLRWPYLREAAIRRKLTTFISYEPALGPLTIKDHGMFPNWIICGGESGTDRRPMQQEWAENLMKECSDLGVPFFMKQMGARTPDAGSKLIPAHLLIRQFPGDI